MKVLFGMPCYGGQMMSDTDLAFVETRSGLQQDGIDFAKYVLSNESLVHRARNKIANEMLSGKYDKLMWIDSDIGWKYADLRRLLFSDKPVIGGTYPMKTYPITLNFNCLPEHFKYFKRNKTMQEYYKWAKECADPNTGEVEVMHVPTGFLLTDKSVFFTLKDKVEQYDSYDFHTGKKTVMYDFFPSKVVNRCLESEDWGFSRICRENGIKIYMNTRSITTHTGTHCFRAEPEVV